jgi:hypothetical protein
MHIIAAKAVCFKEAMEPGFVEYQRQIVANAQRLARGLSSAGFRLVSGGTDNHLMLVDVFSKGITGKTAEAALGKAGKRVLVVESREELIAARAARTEATIAAASRCAAVSTSARRSAKRTTRVSAPRSAGRRPAAPPRSIAWRSAT